jgi:lipopolysaccharide export LptBFGC system permease protein LptF
MIPYVGYFQAKRSLALAKETIKLMNDPDNYLLEAQKDMLELEVEYFRKSSIKFTIGLLTLTVFCVILYYLKMNGVFNV